MEIVYFDADVPTVIQGLATTLLGYVAALALLLLICAGVYLMYSAGNPQAEKRAKNMITYIVIGLVVVLLSYSMIKVVSIIGGAN